MPKSDNNLDKKIIDNILFENYIAHAVKIIENLFF